MNLDVPDDATVRAVRDHNGNVCGYTFGRFEEPNPLIERIEAGYRRDVIRHDVQYTTEVICNNDA